MLAILKEWDAFRHGKAAAREDRAPDGGARRTFEELGLLAPLQKLAETGREQSSWPLCTGVLSAHPVLGSDLPPARRARPSSSASKLRGCRVAEAISSAEPWRSSPVQRPAVSAVGWKTGAR